MYCLAEGFSVLGLGLSISDYVLVVRILRLGSSFTVSDFRVQSF